jgi:hypothetical protein
MPPQQQLPPPPQWPPQQQWPPAQRQWPPAQQQWPPPQQWPPQQPLRPRRTGPRRSSLIVIAAIAVIVAAGGATGISLALRKSASNTPAACPPSCGAAAVSGDPLAEANTYTSSADHFTVDYPAGWSVADQSAHSVSLRTKETRQGTLLVEGFLAVEGVPGTTDLDALINAGRQLLPSGVQDLTASGDVRGAHIDGVDGKGQRFTATDGGSPAAVVIVAAHSGGLGVVMVGEDPVDGADTSAPPVEGDIFDYVLTEFRWPGS